MNISYDSLLNTIVKSGLPLEKVDPDQAEEIFVDRLAEFMAVQLTAPSGGGTQTIVDSNRSGDTVLYAKGYFTSTGTAFGVSTPATAYLAPARYSFGIIDAGTIKFDGIVWSCPTRVRLNQP